MKQLDATQEVRLYETLGTVGAALPADLRREFYSVCWWRAARLTDTSESIRRRARIRRHVPGLAVDDWRRLMDLLQADGASPVFDRWARDAGHYRPFLTTTGKD